LRVLKVEIAEPANRPSKTKITNLPTGLDAIWVSENAESLTACVVVETPPEPPEP
jgi:hypothetical protein